MFDVDEDGILNLMEVQHVLRCLGYKGFDARSVGSSNFLELITYFPVKIKRIVAEVTIDQTHHSLSFNEYLTLISNNRRAQPSEENMIDAFGYNNILWISKDTAVSVILIQKTLEK